MLASAGLGSRRACETLIAQGRVQVDGHVVREQGVRIDPSRQTVHVDGTRIQVDDAKVYLAFNKPAGVVSTMRDDLGRVSLGDYTAEPTERLFHVGRLDSDTEGLILLTNDGEPGAPAAAPVVRRAEDLPGRGAGPGRARRRAAAAGGRRPRRRSGHGRRASGWSTASPARRWSRWCCTRAASTSSAACSRRSATRSSGWCGCRSARCTSATCGRGAGGCSPAPRSVSC
nr:pseudouridine synthase [Angustibacter aerolatus]